jgi:hypothetical protein
LTVRQQHNVEVRYDGIIVGAYTADLLGELLQSGRGFTLGLGTKIGFAGGII